MGGIPLDDSARPHTTSTSKLPPGHSAGSFVAHCVFPGPYVNGFPPPPFASHSLWWLSSRDRSLTHKTLEGKFLPGPFTELARKMGTSRK